MPYLRYYRNESNLGFDRNILKLYELAGTRYIWFLSDDDAILEGGVARVLEAITQHEPAVAVFSFLDEDDPFRKRPLSGPKTDRIYSCLEDLPDLKTVFSAIFISVLVVERIPEIDIEHLRKYADTGWIHVTLTLFILSHHFKFCTLTAPVVRRFPEYAGSSGGDILQLFYVAPYKAVNVPGHHFDTECFRDLIIRDTNCLKTLLASKSGMMTYKWMRPVRLATLREIRALWGLSSLLLHLQLLIYYLTPGWCMRLYYFLRLAREHGWQQGRTLYKALNTRRLRREHGYQPSTGVYCSKDIQT
jgi:glycosyltransferase involved in cell wall biosynthesis